MPNFINKFLSLHHLGIQYEKELGHFLLPVLVFIISSKLASSPNLSSYYSCNFLVALMMILITTGCSTDLCGTLLWKWHPCPLHSFPSFKQSFTHERNLGELFTARLSSKCLGEALFKCLCEFPQDHITQISLFICLGIPSKGSLRFVSLVLPSLSRIQNFSVLKDAFLLVIICSALRFVMSAPLRSL